MNKILTLFLILFILPVYAYALDDDPVKEKYVQKLDLAKKKYLASIEDIRKQMIAEYEKYFAVAMKSKKLDKANDIKQKIDELKKEFTVDNTAKPETPSAPRKAVSDTSDQDFGIPQQPK